MKRLFIFVIIIFALLAASCSDIEPPADNGGEKTGNGASVPPDVPVGGDNDDPPENPTAPPLPESEWLTVSAVAVGDNLIHTTLYNQAYARSSQTGRYDFGLAYENVRDLITPFELAMINQETLIRNDNHPPSGFPLFNSPKDLGDFILDMGFNAVNIANNHTLDQGAVGLSSTLDYWRERSDRAVVVGAYRDTEERASFNRFTEINGVTFSFLGYTQWFNGLSLPAGSPLQVGDYRELNKMLAEIKAAKEKSDFCVVFLHWGTEDHDRIEAYQREAAQKMIEAGADFIHGTHPHVLRDIEYITRSDGSKGLVAYSLANFISTQVLTQTMIGGVLSFEIAVHRDTRAVQFSDVLLTPIIMHYENDMARSNARLYPLSMYTSELAAGHGINSPAVTGQFGHVNSEKLTIDYIYSTINRTVSPQWLPDWVVNYN